MFSSPPSRNPDFAPNDRLTHSRQKRTATGGNDDIFSFFGRDLPRSSSGFQGPREDIRMAKMVEGRTARAATAASPGRTPRALGLEARRLRSQSRIARRASAPLRATSEDVEWVDPEQGLVLLNRQVYKFLDLRSEQEYEDERLTRPARCSMNVPFPENPATLPHAAAAAGVSKGTAWMVADADGSRVEEATAALSQAGFEVLAVKGGYQGWRACWTTSGRKVPPKGRWVASGREALKSGLNVGDAAASYEERINVEDLSKQEFKDFK